MLIKKPDAPKTASSRNWALACSATASQPIVAQALVKDECIGWQAILEFSGSAQTATYYNFTARKVAFLLVQIAPDLPYC
jgi:hypothetical protein